MHACGSIEINVEQMCTRAAHQAAREPLNRWKTVLQSPSFSPLRPPLPPHPSGQVRLAALQSPALHGPPGSPHSGRPASASASPRSMQVPH